MSSWSFQSQSGRNPRRLSPSTRSEKSTRWTPPTQNSSLYSSSLYPTFTSRMYWTIYIVSSNTAHLITDSSSSIPPPTPAKIQSSSSAPKRPSTGLLGIGQSIESPHPFRKKKFIESKSNASSRRKSKEFGSRFGWFENAVQQHLFSCKSCRKL